MAPVHSKHSKHSNKRKAPAVTDLRNPDWDENQMAQSSPLARMSFRCPITVDTVFNPPTLDHVKMFYNSRVQGHEDVSNFDGLPGAEKLAWTKSLYDNTTLMGFIVYSQLFPALLRSRIKLNSPQYHWAHLDPASEKGRAKLEERRSAITRLLREGFASSVFHGLPYGIDTSTSTFEFMKLHGMSPEDERFRFFASREFCMLFSERGAVGGSSVFASCSGALSLIWFATAVLGRPCCLEAVILPLSVVERRALEQRFNCPPQFFDGPVREYHTNWGDAFAAIGVAHRNIDYTILEAATGGKYVEGLHVADAYAVFRATMSAPGDVTSIAALVQSYKEKSKHGMESGPVVGVIDVIRAKSVDSVGKMDGSVLGAIYATYGHQASLDAQATCNTLEGGTTLFDDSVSSKVGEICSHFDQELWKARKKAKMERTIAANMDPAGMNKKISTGRMLDPTDPKSIELMHGMLKSLSGRVWRPLKSLIGEALGASREYPVAFLRISKEEEETLYAHLVESGVAYTDIANLYTLLILSYSFQRSQVLRESTVDEYGLVPDGTRYRLSFRNRRFKTASSGGSSSAKPVVHFNLSSDQSMIVKFISGVGHRFCNVKDLNDDSRRLFVNSKGQNWTQKDISSRFQTIGLQWLGIDNFGPHTCRSFWSTHALNSGQVSGANVEDFSSFLQVSSATLRNSYMSSCALTSAHAIGNEVLGSVVNAACTGATTASGAAPQGKKLLARRREFLAEIRVALTKYNGNSRLLFRDFVKKRSASQLAEAEKWFRWQCTFFADGHERLFQRFVGNNV